MQLQALQLGDNNLEPLDNIMRMRLWPSLLLLASVRVSFQVECFSPLEAIVRLAMNFSTASAGIRTTLCESFTLGKMPRAISSSTNRTETGGCPPIRRAVSFLSISEGPCVDMSPT
jgi:hypothetical protein